ncbi:MAG: hypothetical protein J6N15_01430 [Ruminiclostridium sp.]|nr:hypothetical protein [Ruminiclostridium sp.]
MTIEEQLKSAILERYRSIRAFTMAIGIPYSTLDTVLKNSINNAGVGTMIKVFNALDLDIESIQDGTLRKIGETKKALGVDESTPRDKKESEIIQLLELAQLDDSQRDFLIALLETVTARNQQKRSVVQASVDETALVSEHHDQT